MATYNCKDSSSNAYGAGSYGTCETTGVVGAPDTGFFQQIVDGGSFTLIAPLAVAVLLAGIATLVVKLRKRSSPTE